MAAGLFAALIPLGFLFAPTIIRFVRDKGELIIETDPDVEVTLLQGGDKVKVHDTKTGRTFEVSPGEYQMLVRELPEGVEFKTDSFRLTRGGSKVVDIRWQLAKARADKAAASPLDRLDPAQIAPRNRFDWQPKELVAVLGTHALHKPRCLGVAVSPDGKRLATSGEDGVTRILDADTLKELRVLKADKKPLGGGIFSKNGKELFTAGLDVRIWDVETGKQLHRFESHAERLSFRLALSSNGRLLAWAGHGNDNATIHVWDLDTRKEVQRFDGHKTGVGPMVFSPDGLSILSGAQDNKPGSESKVMILWSVQSGKALKRFEGHGGYITSLGFCRDGSHFLSTSSVDRTLRKWSIKTGKEVRKWDNQEWRVVFSDDRTLLLSSGLDNGKVVIRLWDAEHERNLRTFEDPQHRTGDLAFFPDNRRGVWPSGEGVRIWDTKTGEELLAGVGHTAGVRSVAFSPAGKFLVSGGADKTIQVWDLDNLATKPRRIEGSKSGVGDLVFLRDGRFLLAADGQDVRVLDFATGREIHRYKRGDCVRRAQGDKVVSCGNDGVVLWEPISGRIIQTLATVGGGLGVSPDGRMAVRVYGAHEKGTLFDLTTGKEKGSFTFPNIICDSACVLPDGTVLTGRRNGSLVKMDPTKKDGAPMPFAKWHEDAIYFMSLSPDGKTLATSGGDRRVILWDIAAGDKLLEKLNQGEWQSPHAINQVAFALYNRHLAIANGDGTIYILRLSPPPAAAANEKRPAPKPAPVPAVEENPTIATGEPMGLGSLVLKPAKRPGAKSWTIETVGHRGRVNSVAFSPDGKWLASGGSDGCIRIWDPHSGTTGKLVKVLLEARNEVRDDGAGVTSLAWSPDSKKIAASSQGKVGIWDLATGMKYHSFRAKGELTWFADGRFANGAFLWDLESGEILDRPQVPDGLSPDGKMVARVKTNVVFTDAKTSEVIRTEKLPSGGERGLSWAPDSRRLAVFSGERESPVWFVGVSNGRAASEVKVRRLCYAWSPESRFLAFGHEHPVNMNMVSVLDGTNGKKIRSFDPLGQFEYPRSLSWSPDGKLLAVGCDYGTIYIYDLTNWDAGEPTSRPWRVLAGHYANLPDSTGSTGVRGITWKNKQTLALDYSVSFLARSADGKRTEFGPPDYSCAAFSADGEILVTGDNREKAIKLWKAENRKLIKELPVSEGARVALSPDAKTVVCGGGLFVDVATGKTRQSKNSTGGTNFDVAFSPDGKLLAFGGDNQILVCTADGEKKERSISVMRRLHGRHPVAWSPDSRLLASGDTDVRVFEVTGEPVGVLVPLHLDGRFVALCVSAAGHYRSSLPSEVSRQLVYVVDTGHGQETLTPAEFKEKYDWKNDPEQVRLAP